MNQKNNTESLSLDQIEVIDKHCKDVPATSIKPDIPEKTEDYSTEYKEDFAKASEDFYKNTQYVIPYKTGYTIGQYGNPEQRFDVLAQRLKNGIKEIITDELKNQNQTTEDLKTTYKLLDTAFELLTENINKKNVKLNVKNVLTKLHGFINGYVNNTKIKED